MAKLEGWNVIDEDAGVLWHEYSFAKNAYATTFVVRGADGLVVVSPSADADARAMDALRELGEVRALVANNTFHHLGQRAWRARFPDAVSYCPRDGVAALSKKTPDVPYRPLEELVLPSHVRCEEAPGYKTGEAMLTARTKRGTVWFTGDLLTNIHRFAGPPVSWLFRWTDSAPGFRLFRPGVWFFVKDKKALRAWALAKIASDPPSIVVPAHGPAFDTGDVAAEAKRQLERL